MQFVRRTLPVLRGGVHAHSYLCRHGVYSAQRVESARAWLEFVWYTACVHRWDGHMVTWSHTIVALVVSVCCVDDVVMCVCTLSLSLSFDDDNMIRYDDHDIMTI